MPKKPSFDLPVEPLGDLLAWWKTSRIPGMIIGGLAVALHGRPRVTRDVDALVWIEEEHWSKFLAQAHHHHFESREDEPLTFARRSRMLLLHHRPSGIPIDISLGNLPFESEALSRVVKARLGRRTIPLASVEDLIILKAVPHRDQDIIDIGGLLQLNTKVDHGRIRRWADEFASALEDPAIYTEVDRLLSKHPASRLGRKSR